MKDVIVDFKVKVGKNHTPASTRAVAGLIGVSHQAVSMWEKGEHRPDLDTLIAARERVIATGKFVNALIDETVKDMREKADKAEMIKNTVP